MSLREEHKMDRLEYQGSRVPWWMVLLYAAFMTMMFNYLGTFFFRDLFDWNADRHRMQQNQWQGRNVETGEWQTRTADGEYPDQKGGWFFWLGDEK